ALADFGFTLGLSDLALLSDQASGRLAVTGTAKGADNVIDLDLDATVAEGMLAGRSLRDAVLSFDGRYDKDRLDGNITGLGALDGYRPPLAAAVSVTHSALARAALDFPAAGTRGAAAAARAFDPGLLAGCPGAAAAAASVPAALTLREASGAGNAGL